MIRKLIAAIFVAILGSVSLGNFAAATDSFNSTTRTPGAIYIMWLYNTQTNQDLYDMPVYIGQARQTGKSFNEMVNSRAQAHMNEKKFSDYLDNNTDLQWRHMILTTSDSQDSYNANGWTYLEASLNEQAYLVYYCASTAHSGNPKLLNSRNQLSQNDANNNWQASGSNLNSLLGAAKNQNGTAPKVVSITGDDATKCFYK